MEKGDYTQLARDYSRYRPSYNKEVVRILINATEKPAARLIVADVGAGTGIFTSCMIGAGVKNIVAVEPNLNMREAGRENLKNKVEFIDGSAESTSLGSKKYDLVTMASSFHWPKTNDALKEFDRILSNKGVFAALWNPRLTDRSRAETEVQRLLAGKY